MSCYPLKNQKPKISIVTIVLNEADKLSATLKSILNQNYPNLEIIVIDGGSTDETKNVLNLYNDRLDYWISEPDGGIYDAMNKGLYRATGDWINFMNAGDLFYSDKVISGMFTHDLDAAEVLYGDSIASYPTFKAFRQALSPENLWKGMVCCHQSMFFKTKVIQQEGFKPENYFSADYELILRLYISGIIFKYISVTVAIFETRGISNRKMVRSAKSNLEILNSFDYLTSDKIKFHKNVIRYAKITEWIYMFVPEKALYLFLRYFYRNQRVNE